MHIMRRKEGYTVKTIQSDYVERCYAGWLGKLIGVRLGAPIEGWSYERIQKVYGEVWDYIVDYQRFAADDDSNGPMFFLRALNDYTHTSDITAEQIGKTWLNYAPYEHGFYWWGGYGVSTEHTAYLNLRAGIAAPRSGSVAQNGAAIAEQIGGQIFIDAWGLIAPDNETLAAQYAEKAASVGHGGNGVYGGMFVAAAISAAFSAGSAREAIERALAVIPADCEYARMTRDIIAFRDAHADGCWRDAFAYIHANWGYDRYPGSCHIIPNSAVMVMSMLYGEDDFSKTLCICNMCGWDTDCNVGNVGTIMGTLVGLAGIPMRWRTPINDAFVASSVMGSLNSMDAPWCAAYIADLAYRIAGQPVPARWAPFIQPERRHLHFELPGATHGFTVAREQEGTFEAFLTNTDEDAASGTRSLKAVVKPMRPGSAFRVACRTHFRPADFHDSRYDPCFSPIVYPGQTLRAKVKRPEACDTPFDAELYALDANSGTYLRGTPVAVDAAWTTLCFQIPSGKGICLDEVGVRVSTQHGWNAALILLLDDFEITGDADYGIDFAKERTEVWHRSHHEVSQFTRFKGVWGVQGHWLDGLCADLGEAYTGDAAWRNIDFTATVERLTEGQAGINFRVQGAIRSYCAALDGETLSLLKNDNGYTCLASVPFRAPLGTQTTLYVRCEGNALQVTAGDVTVACTDAENPYTHGCVGAHIANGCHARFADWTIRTWQ